LINKLGESVSNLRVYTCFSGSYMEDSSITLDSLTVSSTATTVKELCNIRSKMFNTTFSHIRSNGVGASYNINDCVINNSVIAIDTVPSGDTRDSAFQLVDSYLDGSRVDLNGTSFDDQISLISIKFTDSTINLVDPTAHNADFVMDYVMAKTANFDVLGATSNRYVSKCEFIEPRDRIEFSDNGGTWTISKTKLWHDEVSIAVYIDPFTATAATPTSTGYWVLEGFIPLTVVPGNPLTYSSTGGQIQLTLSVAGLFLDTSDSTFNIFATWPYFPADAPLIQAFGIEEILIEDDLYAITAGPLDIIVKGRIQPLYIL